MSGASAAQMELRSNHLLQVEYVPIDRVRPNPCNPKRHTRRKIVKLAESLKTLGVNTPILVDAGLQVLSGEARLRACQELGLKSVPVIRLEHMSPEEAQLFMLAENRFAELGTTDTQALAKLFRDLSVLNLDLDLELTGWETPQIDLMISAIEIEGDAGPDPDTAPPGGPPVAQLGDLFVCHNPRSGLTHRILCGDALKPATYAQLMGEERARAVLTDPPFGGAIAGYLTDQGRTRHREFLQGSEGLTLDQLETMLKAALTQIAGVCAPGALVYAFMDWRGLEALLRAGRETFDELKNVIVWSKTQGGMGSLYRSQHELIALFKAAGEHRNNVQLGAHGRNRTNVWTCPGMTSRSARKTGEGDLLALHPTVKPVALVADAILDCTARGDLVLDAFLGSGTLLIAAERTGRQARGIELDPLYVDVALRRWRAITGEEAVHEESGRTLYDLEQEGRA